MHLGVPATKATDVSLKARRIEPAKHLVELFAQNEPNHWHGKFPKLHWLAKDTTENLRSLGVGQLASCNLQFQSDEAFGALKSQGRKGPDILRGDGLVRFVGPDRVHQLPFQDSDFNLVDVVVLHKSSRPEYCGWQAELANMLLNLPLALPMIDARVPLCPTHGTVDEVFHTGFLGGLRQVLALVDFTFRSDRPEVLDTVNTVNAACGTLERCRIFQVTSHDLNALSCEFLGRGCVRVARQSSQFPFVAQHVADHRPALPPGRAGNEHSLVSVFHNVSSIEPCSCFRRERDDPVEIQ